MLLHCVSARLLDLCAEWGAGLAASTAPAGRFEGVPIGVNAHRAL